MCSQKFNYAKYQHLDNGDDNFKTDIESSCPGCQYEIREAIQMKQEHPDWDVSLKIGKTLHFAARALDSKGKRVFG